MAFPSDQTNQTARWSQIQQILDVLQGVSGGGDRVQLTQYNNSSNYTLDVRPLDTTNGYALRVRDAADSVLLTTAKNAIVLGASSSDIITVSGLLRGGTGSVSAPEYSFAADTDCGLYRIGANNLGLALNGVKLLDFSTTGLGIVKTTGSAGAVTAADFIELYLDDDTEATNDGPAIVFSSDYNSGAGKTVRAAIRGAAENTGNTGVGYLAFYTNGSSANSASEHMRISSAGVVGVGRSLYVGSLTGSDPGDNNVYIEGDCSVLTLTDRTPMPKSLSEAYAAIQSLKRVWTPEGKAVVDHDALHPSIRKDNSKGVVQGRNLSALVSAQTEVLQDVLNRLALAETKLQALPAGG